MAYHTVFYLGVLSAALAAACSDSGGAETGAGGSGGMAQGNFLGSCDTRAIAGPSSGQCRDWEGNSSADLSVSCNGLDGTFSAATRCPSTGRVGTCTLAPVLGASAIYGYYGPDYAQADARDHCDGLDGTFAESSASGGSAGRGSGGGGSNCPPECLRPYECVVACGDEPMNNGCCPCPEGQIDAITCPDGLGT